MKSAFFLILLSSVLAFAQTAPAPYGVVPTERQLKWQETEMYFILHFTPTTFENKEWGFGDANPKTFNPSQFDATQIVKAAKAGGLKGMVFVAKHHDGFCLWPTKTTAYNISKSPFRNGKGDMVKEFEQACRKNGLKFGVYCSPWDRNNAEYGTPAYINTYRNQLRELYSNYGQLFMSWHDGANGGDGYYGGKREKRKIDNLTYYGWDSTWSITRKMQPMASIFSDVGLDVRWVGNERGEAAETSWATFSPLSPDRKTYGSPGYCDTDESPGGTRNGKYWMPAECDVPLRRGWFYHAEQDSTVKSVEKLFQLYLKSVGRGACLDLGLAPDTRGILHENDVKVLKEFGQKLTRTFSKNLLAGAKIKASNVRGNNSQKFGTQFLTDKNRYSYWATDDTQPVASLEINLPKETRFDILQLRENIKLGQRVEGFAIDVWQNNKWNEAATGTSIGANKIIKLSGQFVTSKVRIRITKSPACIVLSDLGLYLEQ